MSTSKLTHIIVPCANGYMRYMRNEPQWSSEVGHMVQPSHYMETIDYSQVVDACLDDQPEGRYL